MAVHIDSEGVFLYFDTFWGFYRVFGVRSGMQGWKPAEFTPIKLGEY